MAAIIVTGPSRPDCWRGESFFQRRQEVKVKRPVGLGWPSSNHWGHCLRVPFGLRGLSSGNCSSPIMRFGQRFTTLTSSAF